MSSLSTFTDARHFEITYPFGNVAIVIPSSRDVSFRLLFWSLGWLVAMPWLVYTVVSRLSSMTATGLVIALVFLGIAAYRVAPALYLLAWQVAGKEEIEITPQAVAVRSTVLGIGRRRVFDAEYIAAIHAIPPGMQQFSFLRFGLLSFDVQATGPIAVIYKGKIERLGLSLGQNAGKALVGAIHERLPRYRQRLGPGM